MNAAARAAAIVVDPAAAWRRIAEEAEEPADLLSRYAAILAAIPALFGLIGACLIGKIPPGSDHAERAPVAAGLLGAVFGYVAALFAVLLLGAIINALAPLFGGRRNFRDALAVAVYSATPVWLAGVFLVLPGLHFLMLTAFYGVYIAVTGLPLLMKSPAAKAPGYAVVIAACAGALALMIAAAQRSLFGLVDG